MMLEEFFKYDPVSGKIYWKQDCGKMKQGSVAGSLNKISGYIEIRFKGKLYYGHQLAWYLHHGVWVETVDHREHPRSNNSLDNLREATRSQNNKNNVVSKNSTTGFKGVFKSRAKYKAQICVDRKQIHLGVFKTKEEAALAYDKAALHYHGEFAKTNQMMGLV